MNNDQRKQINANSKRESVSYINVPLLSDEKKLANN